MGQTQKIEVHNLNEGQGYVMIRDQEVQVITNYRKILHSINLNSWTNILEMIEKNINNLKHKSNYLAMIHSFKSLAEEIENLVPHSRNRRGLINIVGKGLKYITGVMDSDDEKEIKQKLDILEKNNHNLIQSSNDQVQINNNFNEAMANVTAHINTQQKQISNQLSYLVNKVNNELSEIENMQHVFQIQYDIQLLREQVRKVKENLLLSQLGVIGRDILTKKEIEKYNITIKDMMFIKTSVILYKDHIIFILMIPNYSKNKFYRVYIEPVPNKNNLEIELLGNNVFLLNEENLLYENVEKIILKKDLKVAKTNCQLLLSNTQCNFKINNNTEIKQVKTYRIPK